MIDLSLIRNRFSNNELTRSQLVSLLRDLYPTEKRDVNLAIIVYDSGIVANISSMKRIDSIHLHSYTKKTS